MQLDQTIGVREFHPDLINPNDETVHKRSKGAKIVVIGKPGCFGKGTKVLMHNGTFKSVEDIEVGDLVMGDDSTPREVQELRRGYEKLYTITPPFGKPITVNEDHILSLVNTVNSEMIDISLRDWLKKGNDFHNQYLWCHTSVDFDEYNDAKNANNSNNDMIDWYRLGSLYVSDFDSKDREKHVKYRTLSRQHRITFLKGVLDQVATRIKTTYEIYSDTESFLNEIAFIARSVGIRVVIGPVNSRSTSNEYLCVLLDVDKIIETSESDMSCKKVLTGFGVQKNNTLEEYYGFTLSGNGRFLLEDCSVVHNTGKSNLIKSLIFWKKHLIPVGILMSGTEDSNHDFGGKIFPELFVYEDYDEKTIEDFIRRQKIAISHLKNAWGMIVIDDCTDDPAVLRHKIQQGMFKKGRHWDCLYVLSLQYALDVKPFIRSNVDGVFIFREPSKSVRENIYKNYASIIPDYSLFCRLMDELTSDHTALYIHNFTNTNDWKECVYYYKAPDMDKEYPNFRFGCEDFWKFSRDRYNTEYAPPI